MPMCISTAQARIKVYDDCFTKRDFRPFQNVIQIHQILRLPRRRRPKPPLILTHACQCFSNAPRVLHLPQRWKSVRCPAPVTQNHVPDLQIPRKHHACQKKWTQLKKRALCAGKTTPRPPQKSTRNIGKTSLLTFSMCVFRGACNVLWKSNMSLRNPLGTLCVSDRSRCGAVHILISLAQPSWHFVALCLSVALVVARCWF